MIPSSMLKDGVEVRIGGNGDSGEGKEEGVGLPRGSGERRMLLERDAVNAGDGPCGGSEEVGLLDGLLSGIVTLEEDETEVDPLVDHEAEVENDEEGEKEDE